MPSESNSGFTRNRPNRTIRVAFWVLGTVALIEIVLAGVSLAPRVFSKASTEAPAAVAEATSTTPSIAPPPSKPLESTPMKEATTLGEKPSGQPFSLATKEASVQGGAILGIVSAKQESSDEGSRRLVVTIKARPKETVDVQQVKVQVYFYDQQEGEITPSKSQVTSNWLSPPVDWKSGEPELLEVRYLPENPDPSISFAGYVVAVYYKGDLQDYRAEPSRLTKLFPLKYFIGLDES